MPGCTAPVSSGAAMGAFEMLTSLEPSLSTDTQLLLECLSDAEKSQIGQALGVALRSLVDLRQSSTLDRPGAQI